MDLDKDKAKKRKRKRTIIDLDEDDDLSDGHNDNKPLKRKKKSSPKSDTSVNKKRNRSEFENDFDAEASALYFKSIEDENMEQYELEMIEMTNMVEQEYNAKRDKDENDAHKCQEPHCNSLTICPMYFKHFGLSVCRECKWKQKYKCLSKTNSKKEYLLSEGDLSSLRCWVKDIKRPNNGDIDNNYNDGRWIPKYLKLYLKYQLEELAIEKWGSMHGIEAERNRREINRMQRSISQSRKKRRIEFECLEDITIDKAVIEEHEAKHVHTFGEAVCVNEETDEWQKTCTDVDCGYVEKWEEF